MKFSQSDRNLEDFGLDSIQQLKTEYQHERMVHNSDHGLAKLNALMLSRPNTAEQQVILVAVEFASLHPPQSDDKFFFLTGIAGSGKIELIKKIVAKVRSINLIVKGFCSTALAAQLYPYDFTTAHA
jgi:hypothetical protein